jgi:DNA-binding transcriptional LysR family regulator
MDDRLHQLALFVRTVESGSFSKAAREFGLSQPSVSRTIAALEHRLGVKLLVRTTRQVSATDAGEALLGRARDALLAIDEAESAARGADHLSGLLRVALPPEYGVRRTVPLLPGFFAQHPLLKIDLMMSDRYENLIAEGADLALRGWATCRIRASSRASSRARGACSSPRRPISPRRGAPTRLADLLGHDVISGPADLGEETWAARRDGRIERQTLSPRVRFALGDRRRRLRGRRTRRRDRVDLDVRGRARLRRDRRDPRRLSRSIRSRLTSSFPPAAAHRKERAPSATISNRPSRGSDERQRGRRAP